MVASTPFRKVKLPTLEHAKSHKSWRSKLVAQMKAHDAWDGIENALDDEDADEPLWPNGGGAALLASRREAYKSCYVAMAESIKLDSEVDTLLISHDCDNVISSLRLLDAEYLELQSIDINTISQSSPLVGEYT